MSRQGLVSVSEDSKKILWEIPIFLLGRVEAKNTKLIINQVYVGKNDNSDTEEN